MSLETVAPGDGLGTDFLNGTATFQRLTDGAADSWGNLAGTWADFQTDVPISIQPDIVYAQTGGREYAGDSQVVRYELIAYIAHDNDWTPRHTDRITEYTVVDTDGTEVVDTRTFEIRSVADAAGMIHHWECGIDSVALGV